MNENLFRTQFDQLKTTEKQGLMESLAARYDMTFLGLHTFDRWGQNCTTGLFEKDGSCSAGRHWPYAGGPEAGGTVLGAGHNGRSQTDRPS